MTTAILDPSICTAKLASGETCGRKRCRIHRKVTTDATPEVALVVYPKGILELARFTETSSEWQDPLLDITNLRVKLQELEAARERGDLTYKEYFSLTLRYEAQIIKAFEVRERTLEIRRNKISYGHLKQLMRDIFYAIQQEVKDPILRNKVGKRLLALIEKSRTLPDSLD